MSYNVSDEMYHYGVKGMRWGHRKIRPLISNSLRRRANTTEAGSKIDTAKNEYRQAKKEYRQAKKEYNSTPEVKAARRKRAIKVGAAVAGTTLAVYGAYKVNQYVKTKNAQIAAERGYNQTKKFYDMMVASGPTDGAISTIYRANPGKDALRKARESYNDSFGKAAKNVVNYKRSGNNLGSLRSLEGYRDFELITEWERRRK